MTVIVSVKINSGIVMATDTAASYGIGQVYNSAEKIIDLIPGLPLGAMFCGSGNILNENVHSILKDFSDLNSKNKTGPYVVNKKSYSISDVAEKLKNYVFDTKVKGKKELEELGLFLKIRICGYSNGKISPEIWDVIIHALGCDHRLVIGENATGANWDGQFEPLDRLILACLNYEKMEKLKSILTENSVDQSVIDLVMPIVHEHSLAKVVIPSMPMGDAIDLAKFMVDVSIGFTRFSYTIQPKVIGGDVDIAYIDKHHGFRWIGTKKLHY